MLCLYAEDEAHIRDAVGHRGNSFQTNGTFLCRSGFKTEYQCGYIDAQDVSLNVDGKVIGELRRVDFDADVGDSGAPYIHGNYYLGLYDHSTGGTYPAANGKSYYTTTSRVQSKGDLSICFNANCTQ